MQNELPEKITIPGGKFINEIEHVESLKGLESIFDTEVRLLEYLYEFNKEEAITEALSIVNDLDNGVLHNKLDEFRRYFIALSAIVTRYLVDNKFTSTQAIAFNRICCVLIEEKLTVENATTIAKELIELYLYILADKQSPNFKHETVNKVIVYIDEEVESPLSVEEIAEHFDVSTSHLSRIFRQHVGVTLVEYINIRKVEEAQYYLRFSSKKIADISNQFYFCNQSYFTRIFKKYTDETPRRFRNDLECSYFSFAFQEKEFDTINDQ